MLENELGVSLFERSRAGVRLTLAGCVFLGQIQSLLTDLDGAIVEAGSAGAGREEILRIGLTASLSTGPLRQAVDEFARTHPQVLVVFEEGSRDRLLAFIRERRLDVLYAAGERCEGDLDAMVFANERVLVALSSSHRLADHHKLSWRDLSGRAVPRQRGRPQT